MKVSTGLDMKDLPRSVMAEISDDMASVSPVKLNCSENGSNGGWPYANEVVFMEFTSPLTVSPQGRRR